MNLITKLKEKLERTVLDKKNLRPCSKDELFRAGSAVTETTTTSSHATLCEKQNWEYGIAATCPPFILLQIVLTSLKQMNFVIERFVLIFEQEWKVNANNYLIRCRMNVREILDNPGSFEQDIGQIKENFVKFEMQIYRVY
jgi:hypothetical protein